MFVQYVTFFCLDKLELHSKRFRSTVYYTAIRLLPLVLQHKSVVHKETLLWSLPRCMSWKKTYCVEGATGWSSSNLRRERRSSRRRFGGTGLLMRAFTGAPGVSWTVAGPCFGGVLGEQEPSDIWDAQLAGVGELRCEASSSSAQQGPPPRSSAVLADSWKPWMLEDTNPHSPLSKEVLATIGSRLESWTGSMAKPAQELLVEISTEKWSSRLILWLRGKVNTDPSSLVSFCKTQLLDTPRETTVPSARVSDSVQILRSAWNNSSCCSLRSTDLQPETTRDWWESSWKSNTDECCNELDSLHFFRGGVGASMLLLSSPGLIAEFFETIILLSLVFSSAAALPLSVQY